MSMIYMSNHRVVAFIDISLFTNCPLMLFGFGVKKKKLLLYELNANLFNKHLFTKYDVLVMNKRLIC